MKSAEVRFYFDADILGLAHLVCRLRSDCTYPGDPGAIIKRRARPACPVTSAAAKDHEWIPLAAERRWVVITRDSKITEHRREIDAVMEHGGRHVTFAGADAGNPWTSWRS